MSFVNMFELITECACIQRVSKNMLVLRSHFLVKHSRSRVLFFKHLYKTEIYSHI